MGDVKTQIENVETNEVVEAIETEVVEAIETSEQRARRHLEEVSDYLKSENVTLYSYKADKSVTNFDMVKVGLSFGKPIDDGTCKQINEALFEFVDLFQDVDDVFFEFDSNEILSKTRYVSGADKKIKLIEKS